MISLVVTGLSSVFCGVSAVLTKTGMRENDPHKVNAVSNTIILLMFVCASFLGGTSGQIAEIDHWGLTLSSGFMLGLSWIFYYLGLQDGNVSGVLAVQNLSIIFTMGLARMILHEMVTSGMIIGAALILFGTILMTDLRLDWRGSADDKGKRWVAYELISSVSIAVSFVLTKMEGNEVDSNLSSALRYAVVVLMMWALVLFLRRGKPTAPIEKGMPRVRIIQGALCLGMGYILFYKALVLGSATIVTTVFRMSVIVSAIVSAVCLKETLSWKKGFGLGSMVAGLILFVY